MRDQLERIDAGKHMEVERQEAPDGIGGKAEEIAPSSAFFRAVGGTGGHKQRMDPRQGARKRMLRYITKANLVLTLFGAGIGFTGAGALSPEGRDSSVPAGRC